MDTDERILRAVFPIGHWQYTISKVLNKIVDCRLQFRPEIKRASGASVSTNVFLNPDYHNLSGIIFSRRASVRSEKLKEMGSDFVYIHNPLATTNSVPEGYFKFGKEYVAKEANGEYIIESREFPTNQD